MPRICYTERNFRDDALGIIAQANIICRDYASQGYDLTLRQLYYQFVSKGLIPNRDTEYKRLGSIINDARLAGLLDWNYITDRTRNLRSVGTWDDPGQIMRGAARSYTEDLWAEQDDYVEVWIEKDALVGVVSRQCDQDRVPYFSCRGYTSQSEMWAAGRRLLSKYHDGKSVTILHLGDHDPSGIDMSRDIQDRLDLFAGHGVVDVRRIALTMAQVERYNPPPNPAKLTDSRGSGYVELYGRSSWELDALDPATMSELIRLHVDGLKDAEVWTAGLDTEDEHREHLTYLADHWDAVEANWADLSDLIAE